MQRAAGSGQHSNWSNGFGLGLGIGLGSEVWDQLLSAGGGVHGNAAFDLHCGAMLSRSCAVYTAVQMLEWD